MDFINANSCTLDIIFGPMFSGKTTELMRRLNICAEANFQVAYINSHLDDRSSSEFSTHNKTLAPNNSIDFWKTKNLLSLVETMSYYDVIGIDEAQFFEDLTDFCLKMTETVGKKVIVAGLNGDFQRKPFGKINELITLCDSITKLSPFCQSCRKQKGTMKRALFSKRVVDSKELILVGKGETYIPVCRECYLTP